MSADRLEYETENYTGVAGMAELSVTAQQLQAGDRIVGIEHAGHPRESHRDWVVAAPYGRIAPSGSWGVAIRSGGTETVNYWKNTDWNDSTVFFIVR